MNDQAYIKEPQTLAKLFPSIVTILGLAVGMTSIKFSLESNWQAAVICIIIAALLDALDGRLARMLNTTSNFGAELDSLCDFVNFGVSPGILFYLWSITVTKVKLLSWGVVIIFTVCAAIRLARFNTAISTKQRNNFDKYFFTGVPAPVGAMMAILPVIIDFKISEEFGFLLQNYTLSCLSYFSFIGLLMASRIPTFSLKHVSIRADFVWLALFCSSLVLLLLVIYPWYTLPLLALIYFLSLPIGVIVAKRLN